MYKNNAFENSVNKLQKRSEAKANMVGLVAQKVGTYRFDTNLMIEQTKYRWLCLGLICYRVVYFIACNHFDLFTLDLGGFFRMLFMYLALDIILIRGSITKYSCDVYKNKRVVLIFLICILISIKIATGLVDYLFRAVPYMLFLRDYIHVFRPPEVRKFNRTLPDRSVMHERYRQAKKLVKAEINATYGSVTLFDIACVIIFAIILIF